MKRYEALTPLALAMEIEDTPDPDEEAVDQWAYSARAMGEEIAALREQLQGAVEALGLCVDRLVHGELPGNAEWWEKSRPYLHPRGQ
jgi:hypothetical protein